MRTACGCHSRTLLLHRRGDDLSSVQAEGVLLRLGQGKWVLQGRDPPPERPLWARGSYVVHAGVLAAEIKLPIKRHLSPAPNVPAPSASRPAHLCTLGPVLRRAGAQLQPALSARLSTSLSFSHQQPDNLLFGDLQQSHHQCTFGVLNYLQKSLSAPLLHPHPPTCSFPSP